MNSALLLADAGNIGLILCAGIDTTAVTAYALKARGGHGKWWATPVGLHLMLFMIAFAVVLDEAAFAIVMRWAGTHPPATALTAHKQAPWPLPRPGGVFRALWIKVRL